MANCSACGKHTTAQRLATGDDFWKLFSDANARRRDRRGSRRAGGSARAAARGPRARRFRARRRSGRHLALRPGRIDRPARRRRLLLGPLRLPPHQPAPGDHGLPRLPFRRCRGRRQRPAQRFPGHEEVLRYLQEFARRFDLLGLVRLRTEVVRVRRDASSASWRVAYCSRKLAGAGSEELEVEEEAFDAVVVCNGHFAEPRLADIAGKDSWPGKQLHSYNYRVPDPFHGQVVVIIGYHPSGIDISREIAGVAKEVHVAIRSAPCEMQSTSTDHANLWLHSMIELAEEDGTVAFQDGSRVKADAIVHCTGYKYNFPFLGDDAGIYVDDNCMRPFYKHVFPPQLAPHISFIGLPFTSVLFPLFQLQSNWVAGVLFGRIELPSQETMMHDVAAFYSKMEARGCPKRDTHDLRCTFEYEDWLGEQCGMEKIEEWRKVIYITTRTAVPDRHESYRDEWDDNHLLAQAHHDFTKYM